MWNNMLSNKYVVNSVKKSSSRPRKSKFSNRCKSIERIVSSPLLLYLKSVTSTYPIYCACSVQTTTTWRTMNGKYFPSMNKIANHVREKRHDWEKKCENTIIVLRKRKRTVLTCFHYNNPPISAMFCLFSSKPKVK